MPTLVTLTYVTVPTQYVKGKDWMITNVNVKMALRSYQTRRVKVCGDKNVKLVMFITLFTGNNSNISHRIDTVYVPISS